MLISCIVAVAKNGVIGADNQIPWYLPADLAYFKRTTTGCPIIMGRNCFESIGRPLPNRTNIVVTRDPFFVATGVIIVHSIDEAIQTAQAVAASSTQEVFIIGGGEIYKQTEHLWQRLYLTEVDIAPVGNVFFGLENQDEWQLTSATPHLANEKNAMDYVFKVFDKTAR
jgi:dihydrofolate reductase